MHHNKRFFVVQYEENWGTRWPRYYFVVYIFATSKSDALRRFNKHLRKGHAGCLKISQTELPETVSNLPDWFRVKEMEILDYPGV